MATCLSCGTENTDGAKFCNECGTPLTTALARPVGEERKLITALFCDLVGSTALGERLDAEDVDRLLRDYSQIARTLIESHGGSVEKFIGDAVVGVFGVPLAHEDDPERAVRAGLRLIDEIEAAELGIQVRIGVNTGEAIVHVDVDPSAGEGFATGDALNTAARIEAAAPVMGVAVGALTHAATSGVFVYEALEQIIAKGKAEPVQAWRALHPVALRSGELTADATPFLGRDKELRTLLEAFDRCGTTASVEFPSIVAEPGIGKSRLVREFARAVDARPELVTWRMGRCLPYGDGIGFWALGEIIKAQAGILDTDDQPTVSLKLDAVLTEPDPGMRSWMKDRIAPLVGLETTAQPPQQEEAFTAWRRFLEQIAAEHPTVLVIEDLHWADDAMVAFLLHVAEHSRELPLFVLTTMRPEVQDRHPTWLEQAAERGSQVLMLTSLSDRDITTLVAASLEGARPELLAIVLERAGGSPLYAEQLAAMFADQRMPIAGGALDETAIPPTVHALLAARIDTLAPDLKGVVLDASVIGRTFWSGAVAALGERDVAAVEALLEDLARRRFIRPSEPSSMQGEAEYTFWHALVRDVAYGELTRAPRMTKHRAAADWLIARAGGALGEDAEIVAEHYGQALELAEALKAPNEIHALRESLTDALFVAATHAIGTQPPRALTHLERALEMLDTDDPRRPEALGRLGQVQLLVGTYPEAARALEEAGALLRSRGDVIGAARLAATLSGAVGKVDAKRGDAILADARSVLEAAGDPAVIAVIAAQAGSAAAGFRQAAAEELADEALQRAQMLGLEEPYRALAVRAKARFGTDPSAGESEMRRSIELALSAGDLRAASTCYYNLAVMQEGSSGSFASVLETWDEVIEFYVAHGLPTDDPRLGSAQVRLALGHWEGLEGELVDVRDRATQRGNAWLAYLAAEALANLRLARGEPTGTLEDLVAEAQAVGIIAVFPGSLAAEAALAAGDAASARRIFESALDATPVDMVLVGASYCVDVCLRLDDPDLARRVLARPQQAGAANDAEVTCARAALAAYEGDHTAARVGFERAAEVFGELGVVDRATALVGLGRSLIALGETDEGIGTLRRARAICEPLGMAPPIAEIDAILESAAASTP
jgi:class 3 adenylate cyclase/tetratricopeptide (TPR) repeat protein